MNPIHVAALLLRRDDKPGRHRAPKPVGRHKAPADALQHAPTAAYPTVPAEAVPA